MSQEYYSVEKKTNLGELRIGLHVFETIIFETINKIDGIELEETSALAMPKNKGPIAVKINKNNQLSIDVSVLVDYGINVSVVSNTIQTKISTAILEMTRLKHPMINVTIKGIKF